MAPPPELTAKVLKSYCFQDIFGFMTDLEQVQLQLLSKSFYERVPRIVGFYKFQDQFYEGILLNQPIDMREFLNLEKQMLEEKDPD